MPAEGEAASQPAEWLAHARSNLALARQPGVEGVLLDHLCFEAQQAAEKAVKAVLTWRRVEFPQTHDVVALLRLLETTGQTIPEPLWEAAAVLTPFAVLGRYPGFEPPTSVEGYRQAVAPAEQAVRWAERIVSA